MATVMDTAKRLLPTLEGAYDDDAGLAQWLLRMEDFLASFVVKLTLKTELPEHEVMREVISMRVKEDSSAMRVLHPFVRDPVRW